MDIFCSTRFVADRDRALAGKRREQLQGLEVCIRICMHRSAQARSVCIIFLVDHSFDIGLVGLVPRRGTEITLCCILAPAYTSMYNTMYTSVSYMFFTFVFPNVHG